MESNNISQVNILNYEAFKQMPIEDVLIELLKTLPSPPEVKKDTPICLSVDDAEKIRILFDELIELGFPQTTRVTERISLTINE